MTITVMLPLGDQIKKIYIREAEKIEQGGNEGKKIYKNFYTNALNAFNNFYKMKKYIKCLESNYKTT